jgi:hypothetical protein
MPNPKTTPTIGTKTKNQEIGVKPALQILFKIKDQINVPINATIALVTEKKPRNVATILIRCKPKYN